MRIRPATEADWPAIWPFYRDIAEAGEAYSLPLGQSREEAIPQWFVPGHTVVVAVDDHGAVLGSAHYGPNRPSFGDHVSTASFMVAPEAAGHGIGRALGEHVVAAAAAEGFRSMQFNAVVETNVAAVRLWESFGFRILTTVPEAFRSTQHGYVGLHIMLKQF